MIDIFSRNIGLISKKDQSNISKGRVLICGVGGMGGVCAEALVRMGVSNITLVDHDKFELVNFNRQIYSNFETKGKFKVDVLKKKFLKINPKLKIKVIKEKVSMDNVEFILKNIDIVVNGMDEMLASLILERSARLKKITIVDAWITPFASVFVMEPNSPHWESFLKFPSKSKKIEELNEDILKKSLQKEIEFTFSHFDPYNHVSKKIVKKVISGKVKRPSFVIVVWLSGILMANEVFKILTKKENVGYKGIFFDQFKYKMSKGNL